MAVGSLSLLHKTLRIFVIGSFVLTLLQYYSSSQILNLASPALIMSAAGLTMLSPRRRRNISGLFSGGAVVILFALLSELVSFYTGDQFSIIYGLLLIGILLSFRLLIQELGFIVILRCYLVSAVISVLTIAIAGKSDLSSYHEGAARFSGGSTVHPNLIGFLLAGFIPLFIGLAIDYQPSKRRSALILLTILTIYIIFTTGSRGSMGGLIIALIVVLIRLLTARKSLFKGAISYKALVVITACAVAVLYVLANKHFITGTGKFLNTAFALNDKNRGIHSGLSGRTALWRSAFQRVKGPQWLFGMGYRQAYIIDNGYITVLVESGSFGGIIIVGSMCRVLFWLWRSFGKSSSSGVNRYRLVLLAVLVIFMANNVSARYLLSYGNQFSILILYMIVSPREELILESQSVAPQTVKQKLRHLENHEAMGRQIQNI